MLQETNATVAIKRGVYNSVTKQTSAPAVVSGLSAVPVYIDDIGTALRAGGMAAEYDLLLLWNPGVDIRDGDQVTGYNPLGVSVPPIFTVRHAAVEGVGTELECRVAMLKALKPAGSST